MQQILRIRKQDRGGESVRHDPDQADRGRGGKQGGRDAVDERHGKMSGQPGQVEGLDTGQGREDLPDLVERALWI